MTVTSTIAVGLVLLFAMAVTSVLTRDAVGHERVERAATAARQTAELVYERPVAANLPPIEGVVRIQVVAEDGVVASTAALAGRGPLTRMRPDAGDIRVDGTVCGVAGVAADCLTVVGIQYEDTAYGDVMVYAAVEEPDFLMAPRLELALTGLGLVIVAAVGGVIWWGVGRTLRPVERIRTELARLSTTDLSGRLTVPATGDEVAELARTANRTLDRLADAMVRQRRFVSDASHELRNPIAGLRTRLEVELAAPEEIDAVPALRAVLADAERLERIVTDLLELSRLDADVSSAWEHFDMADLVTDEVARGPTRFPVDTRLTTGAWVAGDRVRIGRLLTNLLANADRHAQSAIRVEVTTTDRSEDGSGMGREVWVAVHDDGPGISPEERERIFERFARLHDARRQDPGGSGLGLAIAREVALAHDGVLEVGDSPELGGALFTLRLPYLFANEE
ncbi:HAMP domain-containing sensor histidine kinase [Lipingzhangella sp. LS1_29]|uniref:histidine kinase n=1 Tax=Lipingzhangella rawalii TaxID=2055835 RepID=A0ABU2H885_9ACTN|nr:HAMP domain-containing sensor histidine kinase [Lipingzhangella rawalii]